MNGKGHEYVIVCLSIYNLVFLSIKYTIVMSLGQIHAYML
jgi:hypothetical protein